MCSATVRASSVIWNGLFSRHKAPSSSIWRVAWVWLNPDDTSTLTCGLIFFIFRKASCPLILGMIRSRITRSISR